jgi:beta-glucosidase-like glycosyl hydrolase
VKHDRLPRQARDNHNTCTQTESLNKCFRVLSCGLVLRIEKSEIRTKAHLALTKQVATESLVLLENKNRTLPLKVKTAAAGAMAKLKIAVVGPFADCQSCYYGADL